MHRELPPRGRGRDLDFEAFSRRIDELLRADLPDIVATRVREGAKAVRWRFGGRTATMTEDRGSYLIVFGNTGGAVMSSLYAQDRKDFFVAGNLAHSIAGYFDANLSVPRAGE